MSALMPLLISFSSSSLAFGSTLVAFVFLLLSLLVSLAASGLVV
jgi:hypothetical protein